jgi:branched-chain amino acid transport system permease protein
MTAATIAGAVGKPFRRSGVTPASYDRDASTFSTPARKLVLLLGLAGVYFLPGLLDAQYMSIANFAWIAIIGAVGLNLLTGYAGQVSLGQAAFLGLGAFSAVVVLKTLSVGLLLGVPIGGCVAALVGLLIGLPSLRFRGFYLALTTLALNFIAIYVLQKYQTDQNALTGFSLPTQNLGPFSFKTDHDWYYLLAILGLVAILFSNNLVHSRTGRAWMAVRDRDIAASIVGVNVTRAKLSAFMVSSFMAGCAGALLAYYQGNISVSGFNLNLAISYVAMIIIGGLGTTSGAVIGAVIISALPYWITDLVNALPQHLSVVESLQNSIYAVQSGVYGLIIILFLIFESRGVVAVWLRLKAWLLLWPYQRRGIMETEE